MDSLVNALRRVALVLGAVVALAAVSAAAPPPSRRVDDARLAAHARALRARLPRGFTVVVEAPFVVAGDGDPKDVERTARGTVAWAVRLLTRQYFDQPPPAIIDVYLFRDAESYARNLSTMFHETPSTPYGYYSERHHALLMNIATGGGTLVHEMVHPYMHANFPACPPWFNEGLASLYEACEERDGVMVGVVNWRLEGLQSAIRARRTLPLETLMSLDVDGFYKDSGVTYAMARYLCYYLQERGLLRAYYQAFRRGHARDRSGFAALQQVLGETDMRAFQDRWERFCLELSGRDATAPFGAPRGRRTPDRASAAGPVSGQGLPPAPRSRTT